MVFKKTDINIGRVLVHNQDHSSTMSFGSALEIGRNVSAKKNQGFGQQLADLTCNKAPVSFVLDEEMIDRPKVKETNNLSSKGGEG